MTGMTVYSSLLKLFGSRLHTIGLCIWSMRHTSIYTYWQMNIHRKTVRVMQKRSGLVRLKMLAHGRFREDE